MIGAHFSKPLVANRVTHLVCYKFEGEKFNLAKQLGLKLVNHLWLEDCLRTWALLSEEDYLKSGLEMELLEAEAEDSEDDGNTKVMLTGHKVSTGTVATCPEVARQEVISLMQVQKLDVDSLPEHVLLDGKKDGVHSPLKSILSKKHRNNAEKDSTFVSPKKEAPVRAVEDQQKWSTGDAIVCEMQVEKGDAGLTPAQFSKTRKMKTVDPHEMASSSKRHKNSVSADENGALSREANCQPRQDSEIASCQLRRDSEISFANEAVCEMQVESAEVGSPCKADTIHKFTSPAKEHVNTSKMEFNSISPSLKKDIKGQASPNPQRTRCNEIAYQMQVERTCEETTPAQLPSGVTPSSVKGNELQEHSNVLVKDFGYVTPVDTDFLNNNEKREGRQDNNKGTADEIACLESTVKGSSSPHISKARRLLTIHSPSNCTSSREHEGGLQLGCSSVIADKKYKEVKSQQKQDCQKNSARSNRLKIQSKITGMDSNPGHFSPGKIVTVNSPAMGNLSESNSEKGLDNSTEKSHPRKEADKQNMEGRQRGIEDVKASQKQAGETGLLNEQECNVEVHHRGKLGQPSKKQGKVKGSKKQGALSKKSALQDHEKTSHLAAESVVLDKENSVMGQGHDPKVVSKTSDDALVVRNSHEMMVCPKVMLPKTSSNRCFALSGHRQETRPLQALVKKLGGKLCRDSHQWSHQTTHLVMAGELRRTEKLFAAAAAGRWILREDYLKDSSDAGVFLDEKKYEWHGSGMTKDGSISFEAPRKWRELREITGCCALEGLRILLYGECIIPSLDTLRRAIRAGGAELVATSPPYTRFLASRVDFAIVNPGTPKSDHWIQEFLNHSLACVTTDFFVDFVCKPSSSLDRHVIYDTHHAVQKTVARLKASEVGTEGDRKASNDDGEGCGGEEIRCCVCGLSDREDVMLLCGDDKGSGCGTAMHIDCCKPPLDKVPVQDWYCKQCTKPQLLQKSKKKKKASAKG